MWKWYRNSFICVAYLADVPNFNSVSNESDLSLFRKSRWFSRGWTLQELLAPSAIVFYNASWERIGWIRELWNSGDSYDYDQGVLDAVVEATSIERNYLTKCGTTFKATAMSRACVAKKLSWASRRKTTRPEDEAYCLLGLLDVNMPLLYGEGGAKAFRRLQQELIEQNDDESIFAWTQPQGQYFGILAVAPSWFRDAGKLLNIPPTNEEYQRRPPYAVTNKGLRFKSKALVFENNTFVVALNCWAVSMNDDTGYVPRDQSSPHKRRCRIALVEGPSGVAMRTMVRTLWLDVERLGLPVREEQNKKFFIKLKFDAVL